jgi:hypothetical protein
MRRSHFANFTARKVFLRTLMFALSVVAVGTSNGGNASSLSPDQASSERSQNMKINIKIAGKTVTATLVNNETARDFISVLPLQLSMDDLFGREKFGNLPKALSEKGLRRHSYEIGDIAYWSPNHDVAIYYHQDGESIPSPGVIPIAKIEAGTEAFNVPGSVKVTIELAE